MNRPDTPDELTELGWKKTVKRSCDRCGRELGDATPVEAAASIAGQSLPSALSECGCIFADAAIAATEGHREVLIIQFVYRAFWECECGADLGDTAPSSEAALLPHQAQLARDAVRSVINTLENS